MSEWEYRKIDLNLHRPQGDELDLLNAAGAEGWELVGITSNNFAYLKREMRRTSSCRHANVATTTPLAKRVLNTGIQTDTMPRTEERRSR